VSFIRETQESTESRWEKA